MLSGGSQADSAEKQLKLPIGPHFLMARMAAHRREAARLSGLALALRRLADKLSARQGGTEKRGEG
jgi:hypothetical protein